MSLQINSNLTSLAALLNMNDTQSGISANAAQLSSGVQASANSQSNSTNLLLSQGLQGQMQVLSQAITGTQSAINGTKVASNALNQVQALITNLQGFAQNAANGNSDPATVAANQTKLKAALAAIDQIASNTQFSGQPLLNGTATLTSGSNQSNSYSLPSVASASLGTAAGSGQSLATIDLSTPQGAQNALKVLSAATNQIAQDKNGLQSFQQSSLQSIRALSVAGENLSSSASQDADAQFAISNAGTTSLQILQQSGASTLAQANNQAVSVLSLLQNA